MIKTPVHASTEIDNEDDIIYTGEIYDDDGNSVCDADVEFVSEIAKRINMHDDLVKSLQFLTGIVGGNFCQDMVIKRKYKEARELLEKCK